MDKLWRIIKSISKHTQIVITISHTNQLLTHIYDFRATSLNMCARHYTVLESISTAAPCPRPPLLVHLNRTRALSNILIKIYCMYTQKALHILGTHFRAHTHKHSERWPLFIQTFVRLFERCFCVYLAASVCVGLCVIGPSTMNYIYDDKHSTPPRIATAPSSGRLPAKTSPQRSIYIYCRRRKDMGHIGAKWMKSVMDGARIQHTHTHTKMSMSCALDVRTKGK